jgi:hypothetical protein
MTGEVVGKEIRFDLTVRPSDVAEGVDQKEAALSKVDWELLYVCVRAAINTSIGVVEIYPIGFVAVVAHSKYGLGIWGT